MFGNKWAFLVGAGGYRHVPQLKFAAKDVLAVQRAFHERLGFPQGNMIVVSDDADLKPDRSVLLDQLGRIRDHEGIKSDDLLVFYFSGHGLYEDKSKEDYLLPIDASAYNPSLTGIRLTDVADQLEATGCHNIVLFIDACREGVQEGKGISSLGTGSKSTVNRRGMAAFYSCDPRDRSYEIAELGHGSFTYCLLEAIKNNQVKTVAELNNYLVANVPITNHKYKKPPQRPYLVLNPEDIARLAIFEGVATLAIDDGPRLLMYLTELFNKGTLEAICYADAVAFLEQTRETQFDQARWGLITSLCSSKLPADKFMAAWRTLSRANLGPTPMQGPGTFTP